MYTDKTTTGYILLTAIISGIVGFFLGKKVQEKSDIDQMEKIFDLYEKEKYGEPEPSPVVGLAHEIVKNAIENSPDGNWDGSPEEEPKEDQKVTPKEKKKGRNAPKKEDEPVDYAAISKKQNESKKIVSNLPKGLAIEEPAKEIDTTKPHVISREQYDDDRRYDKTNLTFYEGDDVLCGEDEVVIADTEKLIGLDALVSFGQQSDDPDIVYIRNERMKADFEIIQMRGKFYAHDVLGKKIPEITKKSRSTKKVGKIDDTDGDE